MGRPAAGVLAVALAVLTVPAPLPGQVPTLVIPKASQRATVSQTVGLTEISLSYDRPLVNKREIWGKLVPYDSVWRAGANENTVIAFSSPVRLGGTDLPAGRYGLHMIPTANEWTVILSRQANAWGSFSYDEKEDALRLKAAPMAAPFQEALGYTVDDPGTGSAVVTLHWEKLALPFTVEVDYKKVAVDSLRQQLRGLNRFFWQPWVQAAAWCAANDVNLKEAADWAAELHRHQRELHQSPGEGDAAGKDGRHRECRAAEAAIARAGDGARHERVRLPAHGSGQGGLGDRRVPQEREGLPEELEHL